MSAEDTGRCWWCGDDPLYVAYHDDEWGRPVADRRRLFEKICLEGFQAGLAWITILRKRDAFRRAFHDFQPETVATMDDDAVERLLQDPGIVRHRGKIEATIGNARALLALEAAGGSLPGLVWGFEPPAAERPSRITREAVGRLGSTPSSKALSKELQRRGFRFVGPTTMYAFMQSCGLVNDHLEGCPARAEVERERRSFRRPT